MLFFRNTRPSHNVTYNDATFDLPILYFRDAGRGEWEYTKFVANMTFRATPEFFCCSVADTDPIMDLHVPKKRFRIKDQKPLTSDSVKDRCLIKTSVKQAGIKRMALNPKGAYVHFGNHPVAESIKALGISQKPFASFYYSERSAVLPAGEIVGRDVRLFEGHTGESREAIQTAFYTDGEL